MIQTASEKKPLAAALEYRLPAFPVVQMPAPRTTETKWGSVYVERGKPTVRDRDVLDAILIAGQRDSDRAGQLHIVFDLSAALAAHGDRLAWYPKDAARPHWDGY